MIRIAIVEDHAIVRETTKNCLEATGEFVVVCEASCGLEFEKKFVPGEVDVILMDLRLKGQHGAITTLNIKRKYSTARIIAVSMYDDHEIILAMIRNGANAFVSKCADFEYLIHTIKMVVEHGFYFDQDLGVMMSNEMNKAYKKALIDNEYRVEFSETEMRIATLSCTGLTNEQIAEQLHVTKRSIENHRTNMQVKTNSPNFQLVIIYLFKHYLLFPQQF